MFLMSAHDVNTDSKPVGWLQTTLHFILSAVLVFIGPVISILYTRINKNRPGARTITGAALFFLGIQIFILAIALLSIPSYNDAKATSLESELSMNTIMISWAFLWYGAEHNYHYPEDPQEIIDCKYLTGWPVNPYTDEAMTNVDFNSENRDGNFSYIPVRDENGIYGFYLFTYGAHTPGKDVNLDGVPDYVNIIHNSHPYSERKSLTPLEDLLNTP